MIKISKKITFILLLIMCIIFIISLREVNWDLVKKGEEVFKEINPPITYFIVTLTFFLLYIQKLKKESK